MQRQYITPAEGHTSKAVGVCLKTLLISVNLILAAIIFAAAAPAAASTYSTAALKDKDVKRAEKIIAKLRRLEAVSAPSTDFRAYRAEMADSYPGLFIDASGLGESDLKTDLATAVFLHERAYLATSHSGARLADCTGEIRGSYLRLCLESRDGSPASLLRSKAHLHTKWAEAVVRFYRGAAEAGTLAELSEIEAERKADIILAENALTSFKRVAVMVGYYSSDEAFKGALRAQKISPDGLSDEIAKALLEVDRVLAALPRGRLHLMLHNARCCYADGLFWWGKTSPSRARVVSVNNLVAADPLKVIGLTPGVAAASAFANWRNALRYTQEVERVVGAHRG